MSIAIGLYAPGSIATYSDLIAEIRDMMDDAAYSRDAIDRALRKAEAQFNRVLRTPEMETRTTFTTAGDLTPLPLDFLEMRSLFVEGSPDQTLTSLSPASVTNTYGGRAGPAFGYSIEGNTIRISPSDAAGLEMAYYRQIEPLSDARQSNWLLRKHPDLYVAGVLYHLARRERDQEGMVQAAQEVEALIAAIKVASLAARWGAAPLTPQGVRQVSRTVRI